MSTDAAEGLLEYVDASPTPFHACRTAADLLTAAGWVVLDERDAWPAEPGRYAVVRGGSLVAWSTEASSSATDAFRVLGAHTDSPNLRLKQRHDRAHGGAAMVALEPYGGPLLHSWLDRDLGLSGRLVLRDGSEHLVRIDEPVLRVPRLAIHLDRDGQGKEIDPQRDLDAVWALDPRAFLPWVSEKAEVDASAVLGFELMAHDTQPSALIGAHGELVSAPRLDNQATCYAALRALLDHQPAGGVRPVVALFDHEEVGSTSERGAQSDLLITVLERVVLAQGGTRDDLHRAVAASMCASGDMAHASHPNQPSKHEPLHSIELGGGPVLKVNQNLRYASEARGSAAFAVACEQASVPLQRYVHRADLPCGSTIGPMSAARTGMTTVDVGAPQLAMHSIREVMAAADVDLYSRALGAFLSPPS